MTLALSWKHVGPARPVSTPVPPASIGNNSYTLAFDEHRQRLVYIRAADYAASLEVWTWDGARWTVDANGTRISQQGDERHGYYDPGRRAVVTWTCEFDHTTRSTQPVAILVDETGSRILETTGERPVLDPDGETLSSEFGCCIAFDRARDRAVLVSRRGIWELDASGAWSRAGNASGLPEEWHNEAGGAYDAVGKRCVFWIQERGNGYEYRSFTWDGSTLAPLSTAGLPSLHTGLYDPCALFASHPTHGFVVQIGGDRGMWALAGDTWTRLPEAANPPPLITGRFGGCRPHAAHDPAHDAFVVGPGFHEGNTTTEPQSLFFVLRGHAWDRQGVVSRRSPIEKLYGNHRHAMVNGTWYVTAYRALHTMQWTDEGFVEIVDEKIGDKLVLGDYLAGLAGTPEGLHAVSQHGTVWKLAGRTYEVLAKGFAEGEARTKDQKGSGTFKQRTDDLMFEYDGSRLVAWGGKVNNRKSNDTLWLDGDTWVANKKASPSPVDFKPAKHTYVDFTFVHDATLGALVRFGHQEVSALVGELWQSITPPGYEQAIGSRDWGHHPAHDPVTGETLLVDFEAGKVLRFDLAGLTVVATFAYSDEDLAMAKHEHTHPHYYYSKEVAYDPTRRALQSQRSEDNWHRYELDLVPAFEAAKALGNRTKLDVPAAPVKAKPAAKATAKKATAAKATAKKVAKKR